MRRLLSTTLGQILAIIGCSSVATFLLFIVLLSYFGSPPAPPWPWQNAYRVAGLVESLRGAPQDVRNTIVAAVRRPDLSVRLTSSPSACSRQTLDTHDFDAALRAELPGITDLAVRACTSHKPGETIQVLVPLDGQTLEILTDRTSGEPGRFTGPFYSALIFLCVGVAAMSAWAISRVIRPLRQLSEQADAFGREMSIAPIEEHGPLEVRRAAHAFNLMQERIMHSVQNRTRMLAAISHDLRTPLTRMRLHIETHRTDIVPDKLIQNIDIMQSMITSALAFLASDTDRETREWLDLGALISTLCDEYAEGGAAIRYDGPEQIRFFCRPEAIRRVLTNLVDNALHFGRTVTVSAKVLDGAIQVDVSDDGPGIPEDRLRDVIEPFVRLDHARNDRPGSMGLGLSIVKEIVQAHNGTLRLINRHPSGLTARVSFS
ncbi:ATP-binding protein [Paraburkholderia sp.]|uniref:ATP-binding protein n=1 Tax=Paraburkholderia sp. TaxID=1926495 RepID=UPI0039E46550